MRRRNVGIAVIVAAGLLYWWLSATQTSVVDAATPERTATADRHGNSASAAAASSSSVADISLRGSQITATASANAVSEPVAAAPAKTGTYLPVIDDPLSWQHRLRMTAIRQANSIALAELPAEVIHSLAELDIRAAQTMLQRLSARGIAGADRLLASMAIRKGLLAPCLPYTEFLTEEIATTSPSLHDRQLREALQVAPPALASLLINTTALFDRMEVMTACTLLTVNADEVLQRILLTVDRDDENRLFIERFARDLVPLLPARELDADGSARSPYSRALQAEIVARIRRQAQSSNRFDFDGDYQLLRHAAIDAEPFPLLYGLAGTALFFPAMTRNADDFARARRLLAVASPTGERPVLESYGGELMRLPSTLQEGYKIGLFARHLNARGCYPGAYLSEWTRQYRYVEEYAQAMSPVTLEIVHEEAAKYIKQHGPNAYEQLHCR